MLVELKHHLSRGMPHKLCHCSVIRTGSDGFCCKRMAQIAGTYSSGYAGTLFGPGPAMPQVRDAFVVIIRDVLAARLHVFLSPASEYRQKALLDGDIPPGLVFVLVRRFDMDDLSVNIDVFPVEIEKL